ncbi:MAG: hypothetical protein VCE74_16550, partial [Alphaproteobacteria bacterium]
LDLSVMPDGLAYLIAPTGEELQQAYGIDADICEVPDDQVDWQSWLTKLPDAVKARYDISSLEWILHAAAPCPPDVKRAMIEWWGPIINEY